MGTSITAQWISIKHGFTKSKLSFYNFWLSIISQTYFIYNLIFVQMYVSGSVFFFAFFSVNSLALFAVFRLVFFVLPYFILCFSLLFNAWCLMRKNKKWYGFGWFIRQAGTWRRRNHNQNIVYKNYVQ